MNGSSISRPECSERYRIRLAKTISELEDLRPAWERLNTHPNAQIDFFQLINSVRKDVLRPNVIAIERNGETEVLLVGRIMTQDVKCRIGYKQISLGTVRELSVLHGGILGCVERASVRAAIGEISRMLRHYEVDMVVFSHMDTASHAFKIAKESQGFWRRDHCIRSQAHWRTKLPKTGADFIGRLSKKRRYWLRRLERILETDFKGRVQYRCFAARDEMDKVMEDLESVAKKTYQRRLGVGFRDDFEHRRRFALEAEKNWLRAYVLYLENAPCAFWVGSVYKGIFYSGSTGYDPRYRRYELGTCVFSRMVEMLCREGIEAIDYGLGDALYKQHFGDESWAEASVRLFAPSVRGVMLNAAVTGVEVPTFCLQVLMKRMRVLQAAKTWWRRRLVARKRDS